MVLALVVALLLASAPHVRAAVPSVQGKASKPNVPKVSEERKKRAADLAREAIEIGHKGDLKKAISMLERSLVIDPSNPSLYYELALAQVQADRLDDAVATVGRGRKVDPSYAGFFIVLGNVHDQKGRPDESIREYEDGLRLHPNDPQLLLNLGITQWNRGWRTPAVSTWERGVEANPRFASFRYHLAKAWSKSDERLPVVLHAEAFLNLDPSSSRAEEMSRLLFDSLKDAVTGSGDDWTIALTNRSVVEMPKNGEEMALPLGLAFEFTYGVARARVQTHDAKDFSMAVEADSRRLSLDAWFEAPKFHGSHPNPLFERWRALREGGLLEAYVHWALRARRPEEAEAWKQKNGDRAAALVAWLHEHPFLEPAAESRPANGG